MGVLYNGVETQGNTPTDIAANFGVGVYGAGAYIRAARPSWRVHCYRDPVQRQLPVVGHVLRNRQLQQSTGNGAVHRGVRHHRDLYAIDFNVQDINGKDDFAIGEMLLATNPVPEPGTLLLLGPSALGIFGVVRRRMNRKSQEVQ